MHNEDFYTTAAQLLAAFAIALVVMFPYVWQRQNERRRAAFHKRYELLARQVSNEPEQPFGDLGVATVRSFVEEYRQQKLYRATQCGVALFLVGEGAALAVLLTGSESWLVMVAGPTVYLATMALAVVTAYIALSQLPDRPRWGELLPTTRRIDRARAEFDWPSLKEGRRLRRSLRRHPPTSPRDQRISQLSRR